MLRAGIVPFGALLAACTAPGAPQVRTSPGDGEGALISGCQNVSRSARVEEYITDFYLTTWGSAWAEGAMQGVQEGLSVPGGLGDFSVAAAEKPTGIEGAAFNTLPSQPDPFCRRYDAGARNVSAAVAEIMPLLGNRVIVSEIENDTEINSDNPVVLIGQFETVFALRQHRAAQWIDRYIVRVLSNGPNSSIVYVLRVLYISRDDGRTFNQGVSVGNNEAWIMTQVQDHLQR